MSERLVRRRGRPRKDAVAIAMDAALWEWGRWVRTMDVKRHLEARVLPLVEDEARPAAPVEAIALSVEAAMLAAKKARPKLYRAGIARYVLRHTDAGARDYCRCSERTVRERVSRLLVYVALWLQGNRPDDDLARLMR